MSNIARHVCFRCWLCAAVIFTTVSTAAISVEPRTVATTPAQGQVISVSLPSNQVATHIALTPGTPRRSDSLPMAGAGHEPLLARLDDDQFFLRTGPRSIRHIEITATGLIHMLADWQTPHRVEHLAATTDTIFITGDRKLSLLNARNGSTRYTQRFTEDVVAIAVDVKFASILTRRGELILLSTTEASPKLQRFTHDRPLSQPIALNANRVAYRDGQSIVVAEPDFSTHTLRIRAHTLLDTPAQTLRWMPEGLLIANTRGITLMTYSAAGDLNWASHLDLQASSFAIPEASVGNTLVALTRDAGHTTLIDASLAQHLEQLGRIPITVPSALAFAHDDRFLIHITSTEGNVWDLSAQPALLTNEFLAAGEGVNLGGQRRAHLDPIRKLLYVADWFSGLHVYDLSEPNRPQLLSSFHTPGSPKGVVVKDNIAYVADDDNGLRVIDVSDARQPREITALITPGLAYTPVIDGDWLYLASHRGGFQIINIANPAQPRLVSDTRVEGKAWSIVVRDHIAYVACSEAGLWIYDVQDATQPKLLSQYAPGGNAEEVILDGTHAYVAFFDDGIHTLDVTQPDQPRLISTVATRGNARGLALQGTTLFVADWLAGIRAIDISDPKQARVVADYDTPGAAWGIKLFGARAYVLDWWGGLLTLDVDAPKLMHSLDRFPACDPCSDIDVTERYAYVAAGQKGVQIFDIKNALNPTWITGIELSQPARFLARVDDVLSVAGLSEVSLIDTHQPFSPQRRATHPTCTPISWIRRIPNHVVVGCEDELQLFEMDSERMSLTQKRKESGHFVDVATVLGTWVALSPEGAVKSLDESSKTEFTDAFRLPIQSRLQRAYRAKDQLVLISEHQVTVLADDGKTLHPIADSDISLGEGSTVLIDDTLLVVSPSALNAYHIKKDGHLLRQASYPLAGSLAGLAIQNGFVYGASAGLITAVRLLPKWPLAAGTPNPATLTLPAALPAGQYGTIVFSEQGPPVERNNAFGITAFVLNRRVPPPLKPRGLSN